LSALVEPTVNRSFASVTVQPEVPLTSNCRKKLFKGDPPAMIRFAAP
jgi:hypothetical protein